MSNTIQQQVRTYIRENFLMGADDLEFGDADSLLDRHIVDSTGILELILYLEEAFGVRVLDAEMVPENLDSLNAIAAFVQRKQQAAVDA
ncbi:MAG: acyl carrier protein [Betaproteobacteria bacterium]|nr:acyl carrier protein [Betaproteobacteria bacterium]